MTDTYTILVVDDDASIVHILQSALTQAGYRVLTARDGDDACRMADIAHPHLIIMDVMMPRCSGLMATMRIRRHTTGSCTWRSRCPFLPYPSWQVSFCSG